MRVVVQYRAGQVPEQDSEANVQALWDWVDRLDERPEHRQTIVLAGDHTIDRQGSTTYAGAVFGLSVLEVDSLEEASALVADWPEFRYGGSLDVLTELQR